MIYLAFPCISLAIGVGDYLRGERPRDTGTDRVLVTLTGPTRGQPLSADGIDTILRAARQRAGLERATCHQLRHTCLTRLREAGMQLEAVQAQVQAPLSSSSTKPSWSGSASS